MKKKKKKEKKGKRRRGKEGSPGGLIGKRRNGRVTGERKTNGASFSRKALGYLYLVTTSCRLYSCAKKSGISSVRIMKSENLLVRLLERERERGKGENIFQGK